MLTNCEISATAIETIPSTNLCRDTSLHDKSGDCMDIVDITYMGRTIKGTVYTTQGWYNIPTRVGQKFEYAQMDPSQPKDNQCTTEDHFYIIEKQTAQHPLLGQYAIPTQYRNIAGRFSREDFEAVLETLGENEKVLDIGSGYGGESGYVLDEATYAYTKDRIASKAPQKINVEILEGVAKKIPFPENNFDAAVSTWILHYVHNLEAVPQRYDLCSRSSAAKRKNRDCLRGVRVCSWKLIVYLQTMSFPNIDCMSLV
ncbi:hypothetical protein MGYG_02853 [Nannizzia gypsea CBS 118893]|uniref:Methyltransferase type 11 domain-containing protein n=1 Tax=Arthroderma gypseum (strain ATCC MYA-4604 / CBS 118893) TaxID=535722 RepID=E4UPB5_ARTGP|nr:hypothetical protein MGYG_02853 [Nannizzia gypsea CBS 118893]EFQ99841.1 hypothetical protein MGYG_02853 [Nannizzia gypsea CBS 118893]